MTDAVLFTSAILAMARKFLLSLSGRTKLDFFLVSATLVL
jgi:hypothetical protein